MQYEVTIVIDASRSATVEANSPEEAADKAMDEHGFASLCHQCAGELNVGDAMGAIVHDSECEHQLLDTTFHAERITVLEAEIARLRTTHTPAAQPAPVQGIPLARRFGGCPSCGRSDCVAMSCTRAEPADLLHIAARAPADSVAAPQQETQEPVAISEAIERMAADRYKVVPSHESVFHRWAVVAGTGTQQLYLGREVECQNMARKFAGAFLDGAFVAMQQAAPQPAPATQQVGWKCAPVEPTDAMVRAAHHIDLSYMPGQEGADRAAIYRAMLAAAPQPSPTAHTEADWPTNEMIEAGRKAADSHGPLLGNGQSLWHVFQDMLAAAPQPSTTQAAESVPAGSIYRSSATGEFELNYAAGDDHPNGTHVDFYLTPHPPTAQAAQVAESVQRDAERWRTLIGLPGAAKRIWNHVLEEAVKEGANSVGEAIDRAAMAATGGNN